MLGRLKIYYNLYKTGKLNRYSTNVLNTLDADDSIVTALNNRMTARQKMDYIIEWRYIYQDFDNYVPTGDSERLKNEEMIEKTLSVLTHYKEFEEPYDDYEVFNKLLDVDTEDLDRPITRNLHKSVELLLIKIINRYQLRNI